jgi:hypothetical protein
LEQDLFGKPVSTHRIKSEGMLFRIMLKAAAGGRSVAQAGQLPTCSSGQTS